jgi:hemolysin activation/secretion protein
MNTTMQKHFTIKIILTALLTACATAQAQVLPPVLPGIDALPDPAALQRNHQQRQDFLDNLPSQPQAQEPVIRDEQQVPELTDSAATASFVLNGVTFTPASGYLSEGELNAVAQKYIGQQVSYADLQKLIAEINALYRERHILTARAILPPQKVAEGVVQVQLVEGKLGKTTIEGNTTTDASWIERWLGVEPGQPLDTNALAQRLELYNHVNNGRLDASLRPGETFGFTDLHVQSNEPPKYQLRAFADNEGARSIGRNEIGLDGSINGLLGRGDRLNVYVIHTTGVDSGAISYNAPVNQSGGRIGVSLSDLSSHVVSGPYADFDVNGRSRSAQLQYSQPVARWGGWWLDSNFAGGVSKSSNEILGADLGNDTVKFFSAGLAASNQYDTGSLYASLTNKYNWVGSDTEENRKADIWLISGNWIQRVADDHYTVLRLGAQYTTAGLLSSTLAMQMGGINTVRGYPMGTVAGDNGYYLNAEWHWRMNETVTGYAFGDVGEVSTSGSPSQKLASLGLGVDVSLFDSVTLNITAAHAQTTVLPDQGSYELTARVSWQVF